jgi:hypothetical protein
MREIKIILLIHVNTPFVLLFSDEIDVIGYSSNLSDSDDRLSVQSMQSGSTDSGVIMSASRLTLQIDEMDIQVN